MAWELAWRKGDVQVLISKPSVFGFGMNWQHCADMVFAGLDDSYESFYQAIRRCYRFGQSEVVNVHLVSSESEGAVKANLERKQVQADDMAQSMVAHMRELTARQIKGITMEKSEYRRDVATGEGWTLHLGDCVEVAREMPADSIDYSVFSPPFASLYTYSNSDRDMGNCKSYGEFYAHFRFLVAELHRVTKPGRLLSFHCMNLQTSKFRDGVIGIHDFRGELVRMFTDAGWIFHSEVCIWKDPVTAMQRTKALGLLHKTIRKDSSMSRQGIPDYLVTMRKPGENPEPIAHTHESFPVEKWQRYASPVWMDVNPTRTLQFKTARESDDERHICPLQLDVIERAMELWSNPGDLVFSPFAGIGSEGYVAIEMGRRFVGTELKRSYWELAKRNLGEAREHKDAGLFNTEEMEMQEAA
jgi:DNA modification methylase